MIWVKPAETSVSYSNKGLGDTGLVPEDSYSVPRLQGQWALRTVGYMKVGFRDSGQWGQCTVGSGDSG